MPQFANYPTLYYIRCVTKIKNGSRIHESLMSNLAPKLKFVENWERFIKTSQSQSIKYIQNFYDFLLYSLFGFSWRQRAIWKIVNVFWRFWPKNLRHLWGILFPPMASLPIASMMHQLTTYTSLNCRNNNDNNNWNGL